MGNVFKKIDDIWFQLLLIDFNLFLERLKYVRARHNTLIWNQSNESFMIYDTKKHG